jgi:processive 1,2-diacylglycerol beta-glucosyltransferase
VSSGSGHVRAAEALKAAARYSFPGVTVEHINVLDHVHSTIRKIYEDGYAFVADHAPGMWHLLYDTTDKQGNHGGVQRALNSLQRQCARPFLNFLQQWKPDAILSTHFLTPQLLSDKSVGRMPPVDVVVTDYDLHRLWIAPLVRHYYVADELVVQKARAFGLNENKFSVTGIPIDPRFERAYPRDEVLRNINLDEHAPTVMLLSGGMGLGHVERTFRSLLEIRRSFQIVTISGKNQALCTRLRKIPTPAHIRCRHFGYVSNMHELLSATDVLITKSGGLTTAESLAKGVPMVIFSALPGQERRNAEFVESAGAGILARKPDDVRLSVEKLVSSATERFRFQVQARAAGRPRAAFDIIHSMVSNLTLA